MKRHADIRTTTDTNTHLSADLLNGEIDRLRLPPTSEPVTRLATTWLQPQKRGGVGTPNPASNTVQLSLSWCTRKDSNLRPSGSKPDALSS